MRTADPNREERFKLPSARRKLIIPRDRLPSGGREPELDPATIAQEPAARLLRDLTDLMEQ